jgi:dTDP-4-dehydrorhamnose reductase
MSRSGKILILGAGGLLGTHVAAVLRQEGISGMVGHFLPRFATAKEAGHFVECERPAATVNCLGYTGEDPALHWLIHAEIPRAVAAVCHDANSLFIHVSTNAVFASDNQYQWSPADPISPRTIYERSKAAGEDPRSYVLRASFIGRSPKGKGFFDAALRGMPFKNRRWNGVTALSLARRIGKIIETCGGRSHPTLEHIHSAESVTFENLAHLLKSPSRSEGPWAETKLLGGGVECDGYQDQCGTYLKWLAQGGEEGLRNRGA